MKMEHKDKYQFVWYREWIGFKKLQPFPSSGEFRGQIFKWRLCLGFLEIRRWGVITPQQKPQPSEEDENGR